MTERTARIAEKMIEYDCGDIRRIEHFIKVYGYASAIGRLEGLNPRKLETLEIAAICEDCPVSAVRPDVVHFCGRCPDTMPGTLPAKWLLKELVGPQIIRPLCGQVHPVPGLGLVAAAVLWAVAVAVAVGDQDRTSRMSAWA